MVISPPPPVRLMLRAARGPAGWHRTLTLPALTRVFLQSGDRDAGGFTRTMDGLPFVAVPLGDKRPAIEDAVPCTGLVRV